jgi:uncharacterized protein YxjI
MDKEKVLSDQLNYLVRTEAKEFTITKFGVEFTHNKEGLIQEYDVDITFDYQGKIDPEIYDFTYDIQKMSQKLQEIIAKYPITPQGKIKMDYQNFISVDGIIWNIDFRFDESHVFNMSFKIDLSLAE